MTTSDFSVKVTGLRSRKEGSEIAVAVCVSNGSEEETRVSVISVEQYCRLKPAKGEISLELLEALETAASLYGAEQCGAGLLSFGFNTGGTLIRKIMRKGYTKEEATLAVQSLKEKGLLREGEGLEREVECCLRKLWGTNRIRAHLTVKGYDPAALERLPSLLESVDFAGNCARLIEKHFGEVPTDAHEKQKMIASLLRYGYSYGEIKEAMKR